MNIKRGLFRIWLVCSALWVLLVGAFGYQPVTNEFDKARYEADVASVGTRIPVLCGDARGTARVDYQPIMEFFEINPFDNCFYKIDRYRVLYPEDAAVPEQDLVIRTYTALKEELPKPASAHPWTLLSALAAYALTPPLFVLLIGSAFVWAFSGFKRGTA